MFSHARASKYILLGLRMFSRTFLPFSVGMFQGIQIEKNVNEICTNKKLNSCGVHRYLNVLKWLIRGTPMCNASFILS